MSNPQSTGNGLERGLSLAQATAVNMIDMVGIGPFITIPIIAGIMQGPAAILAWLVGALLALFDGMVWGELGAKWPEAGGSYVFLQKLYGNNGGKIMAFLFICQTVIQAPLVIASGSIGFAQYLTYLVPLGEWGQKAVSGALVVLVVVLLYRDIKSIGKISVVLSIITCGTIFWIILAGISHFHAGNIVHWHTARLGNLARASSQAIYAYLGYYNVCHLGAEIKKPEKNIPKSIFISVIGIAILYITMQTVILGVLPWKDIPGNKHMISTYFELIYNKGFGQVATILILFIALASLFSLILGYSRIPFAAARNGDFFAVFGKLHPVKKFPYVSLLALGALGFIFSMLFKLRDVIYAIITMRILIQFVSQSLGVIVWHYRKPADERPYKMPFFPFPAFISTGIWLFILFNSDWKYIAGACGIIAGGLLLYYIRNKAMNSDILHK